VVQLFRRRAAAALRGRCAARRVTVRGLAKASLLGDAVNAFLVTLSGVELVVQLFAEYSADEAAYTAGLPILAPGCQADHILVEAMAEERQKSSLMSDTNELEILWAAARVGPDPNRTSVDFRDIDEPGGRPYHLPYR
jgi:hypothetical protein